MQLINKNTDYAVRTLVCLAQNRKGCLSSREISRREGIPLYFLRRILSRIIAEGWVSSCEGAGGGVKLIIDPKKLTVLAIINLLQGKVMLSGCWSRGKRCKNYRTCMLRGKIECIEKTIRADLLRLTIWSLLKEREAEKNEKEGY